jgi:SAM-dependent methyltransferase
MIEAMMQETRLPIVPADYIRYITGNDDFEGFLRSGAEVFTMLELAAIRHGGKRIEDFANVLDFGCGVGRLMRYLLPRSERTGCNVFACDVSEPLVSFIVEHHARAKSYKNAFNPPLTYPNDFFDLVYSFSVFSHLDQETENKWLNELNRVGKPGCLYLITVHGEWFIKNIYREYRWNPENAYKNGFEFRESPQPRILENDFPKGYEVSFHTYDYIMREWSKSFEVLDIIRGDVPARYLWGNHYFEPDGTVPAFRSMGQDLVILRKN